MKYTRADLVARIATDPRITASKAEIHTILGVLFEALPGLLQHEGDRLLIPGLGTFHVHVTGRRIPGEDTDSTKYWRKFRFSANQRRIK